MGTKTYLTAGFNRVNDADLSRFIQRFPHSCEKRSEIELEHPYANVENAANVELGDDDTVWFDRRGRINAFRQGDTSYLIAYS
jgi:hypothetical protein